MTYNDSRKTKVIKIRVPYTLFEYLQDIKKKYGVEMSELIRFALTQYFQILEISRTNKSVKKLRDEVIEQTYLKNNSNQKTS